MMGQEKSEVRSRNGSSEGRSVIRSFRDLEVWQRGMALLRPVHELSIQFPDYEKFDLGNQVRRACKSVPANIAEGYAKRRSAKEFRAYLANAMGSATEMEVHLEIARELGYVFEAAPMTFRGGAIEIRRLSKPAPGWADDMLVLDLLLVTPPIEDVWQGRQKVTATFGDLWMVSREGLLRLKELSGRTADRADIERLAELAARAEDEIDSGDDEPPTG